MGDLEGAEVEGDDRAVGVALAQLAGHGGGGDQPDDGVAGEVVQSEAPLRKAGIFKSRRRRLKKKKKGSEQKGDQDDIEIEGQDSSQTTEPREKENEEEKVEAVRPPAFQNIGGTLIF